MKITAKILSHIRKIVSWIAVFLFSWMVIIAFIQLLFRWLGISGLGWADFQLRMLVLWLALIGGTLAAAEGRHIQINILDNLIAGKFGDIIKRIMNGVAAILMAFLLTVSLEFIKSERSANSISDGLLFGLSIPMWWSEILIPIAFGLMCLFFIGRSLLPDLNIRNVNQ